MNLLRPTHLAWLLCAAGTALAQWPSDPAQNLVLGALGGEQTTPLVQATSDGGAYVLWYDNASGNYDIRLQRLDPDGVPQWQQSGLLVSDHPMTSFITEWDLEVDGADHAIVVSNDVRSGADWDIYAWRIGPEGEMLWGEDGLPLIEDDGDDVGQRILACSDGAIVVAWQHSPAEGGPSTLLLQRISAEGELLWDDPLELSSTYSLSIPRMAATSDGGFLLSTVVSQGSQFTSPRHLYLRRFAADGTELWAPGGVPLNTSGGIGLQMRPDVLNDGSDGAVCWWYDSHLANQLHTFVQRVSSDGSVLWPAGGVQVGAPAQLQMSPSLALDPGSQDVIVAWQSANSGQTQVGLGIQRLNALGQPLWGAEGITLSALGGPQSIRLGLHALPGGSSLLACQEYDPGSQVNSTIKVWGLSPQGLPMWLENPAVLTTTVSAKGHLDTALTPDSRLLAVWADQRSDAADVYLQNLNADGSLGPGGGELATLEILSPANGDSLALLPIGFEVAVSGFELAEEGGDGLLRVFASGPEGMLSFTSAQTEFDFNPDMEGPWLVSVMLVDYNLVPIEPFVMASVLITWQAPRLEITSPLPGQEIPSLPLAVQFTLNGVELEPGGLHLGVLLNGVSQPDHDSEESIVLQTLEPGANTLELVLLDASGQATNPLTQASVGFVYTGTGVGEPGRPGSRRPGSLSLGPPWPNPFNPATWLQVETDRARSLELVIHNLLGRPVAELYRGTLDAGSHRFLWESPGLPSGVYFARLQALDGSGQTIVQKLVRLD